MHIPPQQFLCLMYSFLFYNDNTIFLHLFTGGDRHGYTPSKQLRKSVIQYNKHKERWYFNVY